MTDSPPRRRIEVRVPFALTLDDLKAAYTYYVTEITDEQSLAVTPPTRRLIELLEKLLWLYGCSVLDTRSGRADVAAFADRCAQRVWSSRLIKN